MQEANFKQPKPKLCRCGKPRVGNGSKFCYECYWKDKKRKLKKQRAKQKAREVLRKAKRKEKRENNPRRLKNKLDKLWREKVIETWGNKCVICGSLEINIHHIVGRRNLATRWSVNNGVSLCALHHTFGIQSAHQHPVWFLDEMTARRGMPWLCQLRLEANLTFDKDYEKVFSKLSTA